MEDQEAKHWHIVPIKAVYVKYISSNHTNNNTTKQQKKTLHLIIGWL